MVLLGRYLRQVSDLGKVVWLDLDEEHEDRFCCFLVSEGVEVGLVRESSLPQHGEAH